MLSRDEFTREYEQAIAKKVQIEEEYAAVRDQVLRVRRELAELEKSKEAYAQYQFDHRRALEELDNKKRRMLAEVKRQQENATRILKQEELRATDKLAEVERRERVVVEKERQQHRQALDLHAREQDVAGREQSAIALRDELNALMIENTKRSVELNVGESNLAKDREALNKNRVQAESDAVDNAEVVKNIQRENSKLRDRIKVVEAREREADVRQQRLDKFERELDDRQAGLDGQIASLDGRDKELKKRLKDLNDKQKNIDGEREDLAYERAELNRALARAKKQGLIK